MDTDDGSTPGSWITLAQVGIPCFLCTQTAGVVEVQRRRQDFQVVRRAFTSTLTQPVGAGLASLLLDALADPTPAPRIFALGLEFAPFYCPECRTSFCGIHWMASVLHDEDFEPWVDSIRGRCPFDHERMLED